MFTKKQVYANPKTMIKFLASILTFALLAPIALASTELTYYTTNTGCNHPFIDMLNHWAEEEVCFLYDQEVVQGHSERNYLPDYEVTRAEFLKISLLNLAYVVYAVQTADFTDVTPGSWYYQYATYARSKGFISGYGDGSFHPNDNITRAEAISMTMDIAGIITYGTSSTTNRFSDVSTNDWFASAVAVATDYGIIEGYGDGSFRPDANLSRAEAGIIAHRIWDYLNYDEVY
jgi:hypothetical protein